MEIIKVVIILVFSISIIAGGVMWYLSRMSWNYIFLLHTTQGLKIVKSKKISSKTNKSQKFFIFKNSSTKLHVKEPNGFFNGKPVREISYSPLGDYVYLEGRNIDKKNYLNYSLEAEERELALWRFQENQKGYGAIDKMQIASLFTNIALVVIVMIGIIYTVISFTNVADTLGEMAKNNRETVQAQKGQIAAMERISEYLLLISQQDLSGGNSNASIVRTLT